MNIPSLNLEGRQSTMGSIFRIPYKKLSKLHYTSKKNVQNILTRTGFIKVVPGNFRHFPNFDLAICSFYFLTNPFDGSFNFSGKRHVTGFVRIQFQTSSAMIVTVHHRDNGHPHLLPRQSHLSILSHVFKTDCCVL